MLVPPQRFNFLQPMAELTVASLLQKIKLTQTQVGLTIKTYSRVGWNNLDLLIVIASLFDLGVTLTTAALDGRSAAAAAGGDGASRWGAVLYLVRFLRIFRLTRSAPNRSEPLPWGSSSGLKL
eukprot:SAG11_NODE_2801_length_2956_cov_1.470774_4_plen_123_part_00